MRTKNIWTSVTLAMALLFSMGIKAQALYVTPSGDVGVGTDAPLSSLEVTRDDGTAQILVRDTSQSEGERILFQLSNKGNTKFGILNTLTGVNWAFVNSPLNSFRISRQGSGVVEMEVWDNGDVTISGVLTEGSDVNTKQDIEPVNGHAILEKLTKLEISEWSYKNSPKDRHLGPMAQDFYAAFGLGKTDKGIATLDSAGVALVAIKSLAEKNLALEEKNQSLESKVTELQNKYEAIANLYQDKLGKVDQLEQMVILLMQKQENSQVLTSND